MEESPAWDPEPWRSSGRWPAPREARAGQSLSSVLNELPSAATLRYRGPGVLPWGALQEEEEAPCGSQAFAEAAPKELQDHPSRELPWPMQARRAHRQRYTRDQEARVAGSKATHWARLLRRSKQQLREGLQTLKPWAWTLNKIGGQYGAGTESYFLLLRFLLLLNVLASVLKVCLTLLPTWLGEAPPGPPGNNATECGTYNPTHQGLATFSSQLFNLLSGDGYLEWSPLFYGFYPRRSPLAVTYLCSAFAIGLLCLLLILHRSASGLKQTLLAESGALTSYSHRVFSAWDFGLCKDEHVQLRRRNIKYELQVELEEAKLQQEATARGLAQQARVWAVRVLINLLVAALLGAAFYGVYWAVGYKDELKEAPTVTETPLLKLGVEFIPSFFISGVNFVLPPVFKLLAPLEGYTRSRQIAFLLLRTVCLRLASLMFLLFSLWDQITCGGKAEDEQCKACGYDYENFPCWETRLGKEMYKLMLFDLLTGLAVPLLVQFPRKLCGDLCPGALGRMLGTLEFQVVDEVLGLIYAQTVVWVGSFFCPLLPLLNTAKFLLLFYLKTFTLFSTCSPASRTFRASTANFFFPLVLLLGLALSAVAVLYSIFLIPPSKLCGPFRGEPSIWAQIPQSIYGLPESAQDFLFFLGTQAFAVPLLLISSILMVYTLALANSYGRVVSELKRQIETEAQNKVFLAQRAVALSSAPAPR
ncbi:PREDICTED: transmembrane channel-like protein 4 [Condylura cristata]|uniref:transmembrane channel-like protein 4 n=1 Tax=Condylura cristata TaxID=143302 RepID=UPI0003343F8D|nr:PREDICTED: transmembrane channel-like protein 4 [Condylura cristata]